MNHKKFSIFKIGYKRRKKIRYKKFAILKTGYQKRGGTNPGKPGRRPVPPVPIPKPGTTSPNPIPNFPPSKVAVCVNSTTKRTRPSKKTNLKLKKV